MTIAPPEDRARIGLERRLLAALFLLLGIFYAWLIFARRLPRGHDTLSLSYLLQYLFLGQSSSDGGIPLWLPYSTHGSPTSWYVGLGGGLLQNTLLLFGLPQGCNALPLFHLGLLFDEVLLLLGAWWLGKFFYRSPWARFFVAASLLGSTFWAEQIWHNHRAVFCIPLVLALFLEFLGTGGRRFLFLGLNLLCLQFLAGIPYTAVMTILITGTYLIVYVVVFRRRLRLAWPRLRPRPIDALILITHLALLACIHYTLTSGTGEIAFHQPGRSPDGRVTLDQFLSYGDTLDPTRYADLLLGISPLRDFTLYFGVAAVPLALLGLALRPGRTTYYVALTLALVFLLSLGYLSIVGMIAFYAAPPVQFYRYLCASAVHLKIPLLLLAGFGIEGLLRLGPDSRPLIRRMAGAMGLLALICGLCAFTYARHREPVVDLPRLVQTPVPGLGTSRNFDAPESLGAALGGTGLAALALAVVLAALARRPRWLPALVAALIAVQTGDLLRWRLQLFLQRTAALNDEQYALQKIRPLPWIPRRSAESPEPRRAAAFAPAFFEDGAAYDVAENYFHRDPPASSQTSPFWMSSLDLLLRAYARQPLDTTPVVRPAIWRGVPLRPPYDKVIGQAFGKLQVFSTAHAVDSDAKMAELMNRSEFRGDVLLIAPPAYGGASDGDLKLEAQERLAAGIEVESFHANSMRVKVSVPADRPGGWLLYCDAWHPQWRAWVNGNPAPLSRAFLAYKAVPLQPGMNVVDFQFFAPFRLWTFRLGALNCALWVLGLIAFIVWRGLRRGRA